MVLKTTLFSINTGLPFGVHPNLNYLFAIPDTCGSSIDLEDDHGRPTLYRDRLESRHGSGGKQRRDNAMGRWDAEGQHHLPEWQRA